MLIPIPVDKLWDKLFDLASEPIKSILGDKATGFIASRETKAQIADAVDRATERFRSEHVNSAIAIAITDSTHVNQLDLFASALCAALLSPLSNTFEQSLIDIILLALDTRNRPEAASAAATYVRLIEQELVGVKELQPLMTAVSVYRTAMFSARIAAAAERSAAALEVLVARRESPSEPPHITVPGPIRETATPSVSGTQTQGWPPQVLVDLVASQSAVLIAGAGVSMRADPKLPDWKTFLSEAIKWANDSLQGDLARTDQGIKHSLELLDKARQRRREEMGSDEAYFAWLKARFSGKYEPTNFHQKLVSLPFCGLVTTNYDTVLEQAQAYVAAQIHVPKTIDFSPHRIKEVAGFMMRLNERSRERSVLHLHGCYDETADMVVTPEDYARVYGFSWNVANSIGDIHPETPLAMHLWSLLIQRRCVFVGFSMSDDFIRKLLDMTYRAGNSVPERRHLAIFADHQVDEKIQDELRDRLGIETIIYPDPDGTYTGLDSFLDKLQFLTPSYLYRFDEPAWARFEGREAAHRSLLASVPSSLQRYVTELTFFLQSNLDSDVAFGGRTTETEYLMNWLTAEPPKPFLLMTGAAGQGKSTLVARWTHELHTKGGNPAVIPVSATTGANNDTYVLGTLAAFLATMCGETAKFEQTSSLEQLETLCRMFALRLPSSSGNQLVVIDGLDECSETVRRKVIACLVATPIRVLLTYRADNIGAELLLELGLPPNDTERLTLFGLDRSSVRDVVVRILDEEKLNRSEEWTDLVWHLSKGDPLIVQLATREIQSETVNLEHPPTSYSSGLDAVISRWLKDQDVVDGQRLEQQTDVQQLAGLLCVACGPLTRSDVVQIFRSLGRKVFDFNEAYRHLNRFIRGNPFGDGIEWMHPRLATYFRERVLTLEPDAWEESIREWVQSEIAKPARNEEISPYLICYASQHLSSSAKGLSLLENLLTRRWVDLSLGFDQSGSRILRDTEIVRTAAQTENWQRVEAGMAPIHLDLELGAQLLAARLTRSCSRIDTDLLPELVKRGIWSFDTALRMARDERSPETILALASLDRSIDAVTRSLLQSEAYEGFLLQTDMICNLSGIRVNFSRRFGVDLLLSRFRELSAPYNIRLWSASLAAIGKIEHPNFMFFAATAWHNWTATNIGRDIADKFIQPGYFETTTRGWEPGLMDFIRDADVIELLPSVLGTERAATILTRVAEECLMANFWEDGRLFVECVKAMPPGDSKLFVERAISEAHRNGGSDAVVVLSWLVILMPLNKRRNLALAAYQHLMAYPGAVDGHVVARLYPYLNHDAAEEVLERVRLDRGSIRLESPFQSFQVTDHNDLRVFIRALVARKGEDGAVAKLLSWNQNIEKNDIVVEECFPCKALDEAMTRADSRKHFSTKTVIRYLENRLGIPEYDAFLRNWVMTYNQSLFEKTE